MNNTTNLPAPRYPFADPKTGAVSTPWWYYLQALFNRTGGASGGDFGPTVSIALTGSPFIYTSTGNGSLLVSGSGVVRLQIAPSGTTYYPTGSWYGAFPLSVGSLVRLDYVGTPVLTFIPG